MNTHVKAIAIGAIIGGSLGYLIGKWYVDNYLLLDVDDWYFENQDTNKEEPTTCAEEDVPVVEERIFLPMSKSKAGKNIVSKDYSHYFDPKTKVTLAELASKYDVHVPGAETKESNPDILFENYEPKEESKDEEDPSVISLEEFINSDTGFDKVTVHYYAEDDVVTDDQDEPVSGPEKFLGEVALLSFGELSDDSDTVYIRNVSMRAEYEVVRLNTRYSPPEPTDKRHEKAMRRRVRREEKREDEES